MKTINGRTALLCGLTAVLGLANVTGAQAQSTTKTKHGFLHRHHKAVGVVGGVAAYKMAKHNKHGFMHRHPYLTGAAAGMAANHMAKKHTK